MQYYRYSTAVFATVSSVPVSSIRIRRAIILILLTTKCYLL